MRDFYAVKITDGDESQNYRSLMNHSDAYSVKCPLNFRKTKLFYCALIVHKNILYFRSFKIISFK